MKIITWNARDLNSLRKKKLLKKKIKIEKLDLIFIQESKFMMDKIKKVDMKLGKIFSYIDVEAHSNA